MTPDDIEQARLNRFMAARVGTYDWTVAPKLTRRLKAIGYKAAITEKQRDKFLEEYRARFGE